MRQGCYDTVTWCLFVVQVLKDKINQQQCTILLLVSHERRMNNLYKYNDIFIFLLKKHKGWILVKEQNLETMG